MVHFMQPVRAIPTGQLFAEAIFKRAGKTTKVNHVTSEQYAKMNPASANRPSYSILENYMMKLTDGYKMAEWRDALDEYENTGIIR